RPPTRASDATNILPYCDIFAGNLRYFCGNFIHDRSSCPITCRRQSGVLKHCRHSDERPEIAVRSQSFHDQVAATREFAPRPLQSASADAPTYLSLWQLQSPLTHLAILLFEIRSIG